MRSFHQEIKRRDIIYGEDETFSITNLDQDVQLDI